MKKFLFLPGFLLLAGFSFAQNTFSYSLQEQSGKLFTLSALRKCHDNGLIATGYSYVPIPGIAETFHLIKLDSTGQVQFRKEYDTDPFISATIVYDCGELNDHSGYFVFGCDSDNATQSAYNFLWFFDNAGNRTLAKNYENETSFASPQSPGRARGVQLPDNRFVLAVSYGRYCSVMMTDDDGDVLWIRKYSTDAQFSVSNYTRAADVNNSGVIVASATYSQNKTFYYAVDTAGNLLWTKNHSDNLIRHAIAVQATSDGNFIISNGRPPGAQLFKITPAGTVLWNKYFSSVHYFHAVRELSNGELLLSGTLQNSSAFVALSDAYGNVYHAQQIGSMPAYTGGGGVMADVLPNGDIGVAFSVNAQNLTGNLCILKTDSELKENCAFSETSISAAEAGESLSDIAFYEAPPIQYNTSVSLPMMIQDSLTAVDFCSLVSVTESNTSSFNISPNPAVSGSSVTISFGDNSERLVSVSDAQGRLLRENKFKTDAAVLGTEGLAPGVYFIRIADAASGKAFRLVIQ